MGMPHSPMNHREPWGAIGSPNIPRRKWSELGDYLDLKIHIESDQISTEYLTRIYSTESFLQAAPTRCSKLVSGIGMRVRGYV
jgi:hypothetical protein